MKNRYRNLFLVFMVFFSIGSWYVYSENTYSTEMAKNWDSIKDDFEMINSIVIEYFENNEIHTIDMYEFKKKLDKQQIAAFENIENYYLKYGDYGGKITNIEFNNGIIEYFDWENYGYLEKIIYTTYSKFELKKIYNKGERQYVIEELGNNCYYLDEHHL
ncbi:MAG: hypothetical protein J6J60_10260 [Clostridia bacterium]|nr:hypothetical protein [Clostridia bacterium]